MSHDILFVFKRAESLFTAPKVCTFFESTKYKDTWVQFKLSHPLSRHPFRHFKKIYDFPPLSVHGNNP
jgi:hypothetical protein